MGNFYSRSSSCDSKETFRQTLHQLMNNDPQLKHLYISPSSVLPDSVTDWATLGDVIGRNSHLMSLFIGHYGKVRVSREILNVFCQGLTKNKSIRVVALANIEGMEHAGLETLRFMLPFFENNQEIDTLFLNGIELGRQEAVTLRRAMECCTSLKRVTVFEGMFSHVPMKELFGSFKGLGELNLSYGNVIDRKTLELLSSLLKDPQTKLQRLVLDARVISGDKIDVLVEGLKHNKSLQTLDLTFNNKLIHDSGWEKLTNVFRWYNHTLCNLGPKVALPLELKQLLDINGKMNDKDAATRKGLFYNFLIDKFDEDAFTDIGENLLPLVVPFILASVNGSLNNYDGRTEISQRSALYHFLRRMPLVFAL